MKRIDAILARIRDGVALGNQGRFVEARELLIGGVIELRKIIGELSLSNPQRSQLIRHCEDATEHIRRVCESLRSSGDGGSVDLLRQTPSPCHSADLHQQNSHHRYGDGDDYLSFLDDDVRGSVERGSRLPAPLGETGRKLLDTPESASLSSMPSRCGALPRDETVSSVARWAAPRTPEAVLMAIDVAATLVRRKELKRAIDVLQHAYDTGNLQRIKPRNFKNIEEHLVLLRCEYYKQFKPRPLQDNPILPGEMSILQKSGITTTITLPIWDDMDNGYGSENVFVPCEGHWEDSFTPKLSSVQVAAGARYVRIGEARRDAELCIVRAANPLDVRQTVVGDCSMVCSLIICALYQQRFPKAKIITNVIFPQGADGVPVVNPKGKYCIKMLVNGATRVITVDDRFPVNPKTGELLCTHSRDKSELWVSIMEKAFVKVCGGSYDFPGSSSSSDLYKLSGWLPDSVDFTEKNFDKDSQWQRLFGRYVEGSVVMTVNTPLLSEIEERRVALASEHAYAVMDMREVSGLRLVQLKNPWGRRAWSGRFSLCDKKAEVVRVLALLKHGAPQADEGVFWMLWEDLCANFCRCSLSWNPYMLFRTPGGMSRKPTRLSCHCRFPYTTSTGQSPQFHIGVTSAPTSSRMHLVFSRHMTDLAAFGQQFDHKHPNVPYVAIKVYNITQFPSIAQRLGAHCTLGVCCCRRLAHGTELDVNLVPLVEPTYRNMAAHTFSFDCPAGTSDLLVVVSRLESTVKLEFSFSLTLHTEWPQALLREPGQRCQGVYMHAIPRSCLKYSTVTLGQWVKGVSCGGRSFLQTFVYNPQYRLTLSRPAMVSVRLCIPERHSDCNNCSAQVYLVRKEQAPAWKQVQWAGRVDSTSKCSFHLCAPLFAHGGVVVDTSLRSCLPLPSVVCDSPGSCSSQSGPQLPGELWLKAALSTKDGPLPPLPAGEYTIIPAQWGKGIPAAFELTVETTEPHQLQEIVQEGVGWTETTVRGSLQGGTVAMSRALMSATDTYITSNSKVSIVPTTTGLLIARLLLLVTPQAEQEESEASSVSTHLALFRVIDGTSLQRVAESGAYKHCGVSLDPASVEANARYIVVISSYTPSNEKYVLRIYSSGSLRAEVL